MVLVNTLPIRELTEFSVIPVISPLGIDGKKETYNVNADEAAAKVASALQVQKLMILTNVQGIMRDPKNANSLIRSLHVDEVQGLIKDKVITDGMIPKVNSCVSALQAGIKKAHIIDGRIKHSLLLEIFTDEGIGSEIIL